MKDKCSESYPRSTRCSINSVRVRRFVTAADAVKHSLVCLYVYFSGVSVKDRQMHRQTDRQTDQQTNRPTESLCVCVCAPARARAGSRACFRAHLSACAFLCVWPPCALCVVEYNLVPRARAYACGINRERCLPSPAHSSPAMSPASLSPRGQTPERGIAPRGDVSDRRSLAAGSHTHQPSAQPVIIGMSRGVLDRDTELEEL